jgi:hypothetical protein
MVFVSGDRDVRRWMGDWQQRARVYPEPIPRHKQEQKLHCWSHEDVVDAAGVARGHRHVQIGNLPDVHKLEV